MHYSQIYNDNRKVNITTRTILSILINICILALALNTSDLMYETNDDYGIAEMISDGYPYVGFVSFFLCKALIAFQNLFPGLNIFVISQLLMSFISFVTIVCVLLSANKIRVIDLFIAIAVVIIFSYDHYSSIQFTKTSALLMTAGLVLLADNHIRERRIAVYIVAFVLFYLGVAYRQKGMFPALSYTLLFMLIWLIYNHRDYFKGRHISKELGYALLISAILIIPYGLDLASDMINESTPELKAAREYNAERVKVTDYPLLGNYKDKAIEYESAGLSENDVYIVDRFILDYDGAASIDNLKKINSINYQYMLSNRSVKKTIKKFGRETLYSLKTTDFTGIHIVILIVLAIVLFLRNHKNWLYIMGIGGLTVALYLAIYYMQRPQYRAFYVADIGAAIWLLYILTTADEETKGKKKSFISEVVPILLIVMLIIPATQNLNAYRSYIEKQIEPIEVTEFFYEHPDCVFVAATSNWRMRPTYLTPLKTPEITPNVFATGGWETMTPHELGKLHKYGINNPVKDLIDNPKAFLFGEYKTKELLEYYNKWYTNENEEIVFEKEDEIEKIGIYKIIKSSSK